MWLLAMLAAGAGAGAGVTPEQALALPPAVVGERLLAARPGPIVEVRLFGDGIPPAPGQPRVTEVTLYERARPGAEPDFCEKVRHVVRLQPVLPSHDGTLPPASAAADSPTTLHRLRPTAAGAGCEARGDQFFSVGDGDAALVFSHIRALAAMQADPARLQGIAFIVDDALGRAGILAPGETGPLTDARRALRAFPTSEINRYFYRSGDVSSAITFQAGAWAVELITGQNSYATASVVVRRSPPPPPF